MITAARRSVAALAALPLLVSALAFGAGAGAASAATASDDPVQYVALGDSYSAGFGLEPYSELPASGCYQADADYPHLVATALGLELDDRTCSGAVTANIRNTPQTTITGAGVAPVQADALSADTDVVTVSIGGNDLGFADVATLCLAQAAQGPLFLPGFQNCRSYYVQGSGEFEVDQLKAKLDGTVAPALAETFALIAQKAPNAKVFVVGYPTISPDIENVPAGGCFTPMVAGDGSYPQNAFPFTDVDTGYLHETEARLDAAIRTAAEGAGATYISTLPQTESHSACSRTEPYVNGVTLEATGSGPGTPTGVPGLSAKLGVLHPNAAGVAFLATEVGAAIAAAMEPVVEEPSPTPTPGDSPAPTPSATATAPPPAASAGGPGHPSLAATGADPLPLVLAALAVLAAGAVAARRPDRPRA